MAEKTDIKARVADGAAPEPKDIHEAINAIMKEVGYVQKTASPSLRYTYAGERNLIAACRPAMVRYGVYMSVVDLALLDRERYTTERGTPMVSTNLLGTVRFTHAPSKTSVDVMVTGEGSDSGDKSFNKAMTGLYKYAIRQTLMIETGDDPDQFNSEVMQRSNNGHHSVSTIPSRPAVQPQPRPAAQAAAPNPVPLPAPAAAAKGSVPDAEYIPVKNSELVDYAWKTVGIGGDNRELAKQAVGMVYHRLKITAPSEDRWEEIKGALDTVKEELAGQAAQAD